MFFQIKLEYIRSLSDLQRDVLCLWNPGYSGFKSPASHEAHSGPFDLTYLARWL